MEDINPEAEKQKRRMYSVSDTDNITIGNFHYLLLMMVSPLTPFLQRQYSYESSDGPRGVQCQTQ